MFAKCRSKIHLLSRLLSQTRRSCSCYWALFLRQVGFNALKKCDAVILIPGKIDAWLVAHGRKTLVRTRTISIFPVTYKPSRAHRCHLADGADTSPRDRKKENEMDCCAGLCRWYISAVVTDAVYSSSLKKECWYNHILHKDVFFFYSFYSELI